jgi:hypothetical protein
MEPELERALEKYLTVVEDEFARGKAAKFEAVPELLPVVAGQHFGRAGSLADHLGP